MPDIVLYTVWALCLLGLAGVFRLVTWDARRVGVSHPRFWAGFVAGSAGVGLGLFFFVDAAPLTGVLLTANTGAVVYTFEREDATRSDDPNDDGAIIDRSGDESVESGSRS